MNLQSRKLQLLALCFAALAVCAISVHAQSGRRQSKPAPAAPVPTPTPEPTPSPIPKIKEPEIGFLIGADTFGGYESYPLTYYDAAMHGCGDRLRDASSAHVDVSQNNMSRGEAIKRAKAETKTYVVLMKLILDESARSLDDLELEFVVFAPQTGKVVINGRAYLNTNRTGPLIVGPRGTSGGALYREQQLKRAGEDAAQRILKALNLDVPILH